MTNKEYVQYIEKLKTRLALRMGKMATNCQYRQALKRLAFFNQEIKKYDK